MKMKNCITYFIVAGALLLCGACNDEWKEEIYRKEVGLKSVLNSQGVTNVYLRYKSDGEVTYRLPVIVGGSQVNDRNLDVRIEVDNDTLADLNEARWKKRTDLYYKQLNDQYFELPSPSCHIPSGECVGLYDIKFKFNGLNLVDKWVLPLTIVDGPSYQANPRKNYRKALMRVMPFNDYSGGYSATSMNVFIEDNTSAMTAASRTLFVVSENQCFFYAGVISEELIDREKYKIVLTFNEDGTMAAKAADPGNEMNFQVVGNPTYTTSMQEDATIPYLEHHYTTIYLKYKYNDVTTYGASTPIAYRAEGSMLMERKINSLIPDEDQAIQW